MRIRTIKPEFWTNPVMSKQKPEVRLLAIALLNYSDDEGYFRADSALVRSSCFPFIEGSMMILGWLTELSKIEFVEVCDNPKEGKIGRVVNFLRHQQIQRPRPSKLRPYWISMSNHRQVIDSSLEEQGTGKGMEWNGTSTSPAESPAAHGEGGSAEKLKQELADSFGEEEKPETVKPPKTPKASDRAKASGLAEVITFTREIGLTTADGEWFWDKCEGCGWKNNGKAIVDWKATVRAWKRIFIFPSQLHLKKNGGREPGTTPPAAPEKPGRQLSPRFWEFIKARNIPKLTEDAKRWKTDKDLPSNVREDYLLWKNQPRLRANEDGNQP